MIKKIYKSAAEKISASKYGRISLGGKKLSETKTKEFIVSQLKSGGTSGRTLEESLKEQGLNKSQLAKRKRLIKMLTGADDKKMTKVEERRLAEKIRMRIRAARQASDMAGGGGGDRKRSVAESIKARKLNKAGALSNAITQDGEKITGEKHLGTARPDYSVSVGQGMSRGSASVGSGPTPSTGGASTSPPIGFNRMG